MTEEPTEKSDENSEENDNSVEGRLGRLEKLMEQMIAENVKKQHVINTFSKHNNQNNRSYNNRKSDLKTKRCFTCGKTGHLSHKCYHNVKNSQVRPNLRRNQMNVFYEQRYVGNVNTFQNMNPNQKPFFSSSKYCEYRPSSREHTFHERTAHPTTAHLSTAHPSTADPSTAHPSTADPSTAHPSTADPSTAHPSTADPSTAHPSTADPSTAHPSTAHPSTTESICKKLKVFFSNTRSLVNKINEFKITVFQNNYVICLLNETWLNSDIPDQLILENYTIFRKDRTDKRGGGVLIAVKNEFKCSQKIVSSLMEDIFVEVFTKDKKMLFCTLYRPPNIDISFTEYLSSRFSEIDISFYDISCFLGDFNTNFSNNDINTNVLKEEFLFYGLKQMISEPTYPSIEPKTI